MERLRALIEELVEEHRSILRELKKVEENLEDNLEKLIQLMEHEVERHALKEESELRELAEGRFDFYVLEFAHEQV